MLWIPVGLFAGWCWNEAQRNKRRRRNPVTVTQPSTRTSTTVPGHLYFHDAYLHLAPQAVCSFDGAGQSVCVDPSGFTMKG